MPAGPYAIDMLIVGGGIAGSSLGRAMSLSGFKVVILEKQRAFTDRVRGEVLHPWGVVEAKKLGIDQILLSTCGREVHQEWS